jgi:ribosomal protein S18 acetylase RimI-like enzyme
MTLIKALQENFFATGRYWGNLNSSFTGTQAIYAMSTGILSADLNWVWNEKPLTIENASEISQIKNYYEQLALPFWWWVYPSGQSLLTKAMLEGAGFHFLTAIPCLAADLSGLTVDTGSPSAITISLVENNKDLACWEEISFAGFAMDVTAQKQYHNFVVSFNICSASPLKLSLAYFDGKPVATALLFFYKDTAGIYFVSTLPAYRRRGIGLSLTQATMQYAQRTAAKYIILQSSDAGLKVYKQAGFKEYCRADVYSLATS